ncbi:hypothetical protein CYMTET_25117 [Cymbomonas tetramitiformis]|uniref:Uncharacterized protein n=1 Tax=Cymbomonas tetramitiformis TaxID=36881 RepID=A0AAE0FUR5_9CHLO|nr:hypothetical protein CYMTET_25117 [Cymbomonas tetramitiformis]
MLQNKGTEGVLHDIKDDDRSIKRSGAQGRRCLTSAQLYDVAFSGYTPYKDLDEGTTSDDETPDDEATDGETPDRETPDGDTASTSTSAERSFVEYVIHIEEKVNKFDVTDVSA